MEENKILEMIEKLNLRLQKIEKQNERIQNNAKTDAEIANNKHHICDPNDMPDGCVSYVGKYNSPDGSMGTIFGYDTFRVAKMFEYDTFEICNVLTAFSSEERIDILKSLLHGNKSAKELMQELNFNSTGKLYHHLSFLEKIGALRKNNEKYQIVGKYISSILLVLISACVIIDDGKNPPSKEIN